MIEELTTLLAKVEAGVKYETMGHTRMCQKAFPKPDDFDGSREAYAASAAQQAVLAWRNGSLDAAKALHEAVLPMTEKGPAVYINNDDVPMVWYVSIYLDAKLIGEGEDANNPAHAWLIAILKALIAKEKAQ